ncbi:YIP1 family protein [Paenibacillus sp. J5C2022]|uniref:YIP1 family protein n=1 Tax=Paenibacillus sp. J5C2022 TaxID=2977129 RepID=UPI0021D0D257|nr:YIP1 family protein [Paenibacillus sp. J5C2022]
MIRMCIQARFIAVGILILAITLSVLPMRAHAEVIYSTWTKDSYNALVWTQPVYTPVKVLGNQLQLPDPDQPGQMKSSPLADPQDVFVDANDHVYIVDTGNQRIVHYDAQWELVRIITVDERHTPLHMPQGIFVTDSGDMYIADMGNNRVVHLNADGEFIRALGRPDSKFLPDDYKYDPYKVVVDKRGYLYINTLGGYYGLIQLDQEGNFAGFYGANPTPFSVVDAFKRAVYTREMYANELSKLPPPILNVATGPQGFIYTVSSSDQVLRNQVKRLNYEGVNILVTSDEYAAGGDSGLQFAETIENKYVNRKKVNPILNDAAIDDNGNVITVDSSYKFINHYDANGNLLFFWGGASSTDSSQLGLVRNPIAVDVNSRNDLFLLDNQENVLQVLQLSEFGKLVYTANELTLNGYYEESESYWEEVLRLNSLYTPAMLGLGKAAYKKGDYSRAMELFEQAGHQKGYSDAFWQVRLQWFQNNFSLFATLFLSSVVLLWLIDKVRKRIGRSHVRKQSRHTPLIVQQLKHALYILRHPIDGFTAIRFENKASYGSAFVMLLVVYGALVIGKLYTSFTFDKTLAVDINIIKIGLQFLLIWFAWVVCNYLISSIYRGEGRFKDVFISSAYALVPLVLIGIPLALMSNAMTIAEGAIYQYLLNGMYVWVGLMFFWKVQSLHSYTVGETVVNISLTIFSMLVLGVVIFIVIGLTNELRIFIYEVYQEVYMR